ncbi:MAG: hypothetical protein IJ716_10610 [Lachnospiraceae bacterium]|nr:hypothetical protein [Lachnospiraceae bacterium]
MKKIGRQMSLLMGVTLSFFLSLTGILSSGQFTFPGFLINFLISSVISLIIGFLVPMKKVNDSLGAKLGLKQHTLKTRLFESLISDLIYTPIITLVMITLAHRNATSHGARIPYVPMLLKGILISMAVGYVLIFIFMPLFMKLVMKHNMPEAH